MSGAWVRRARLHAADGAPMPTKQTSLLLSARDATMVIISVGVHLDGAVMGPSSRKRANAARRDVRRDSGDMGELGHERAYRAKASGPFCITLASIHALKLSRSRAISSQAS